MGISSGLIFPELALASRHEIPEFCFGGGSAGAFEQFEQGGAEDKKGSSM